MTKSNQSELDRALRLLEGGIVCKGNDKTGYPVYYAKPYPIWVNEQKAAAKAAILSAVEAMGKRVIGNDEEFWTDHFGDYHNVPTDSMRSRNDLRAEQRIKLAEWLKEKL